VGLKAEHFSFQSISKSLELDEYEQCGIAFESIYKLFEKLKKRKEQQEIITIITRQRNRPNNFGLGPLAPIQFNITAYAYEFFCFVVFLCCKSTFFF